MRSLAAAAGALTPPVFARDGQSVTLRRFPAALSTAWPGDFFRRPEEPDNRSSGRSPFTTSICISESRKYCCELLSTFLLGFFFPTSRK